MQPRFQKCAIHHLDSLIELSRSTFKAAFEAANDPEDFKNYMDTSFHRERLKAELENPNSAFYFVYVENECCAYFKLNENEDQTDIRESEAMEIERIYVVEEFQGRKLGHSMMQEIKNLALGKGKQYIWLGVWERNSAAIAFYLREGFVIFGTHPYSIGSDEQTDYLMRLDLIDLANS